MARKNNKQKERSKLPSATKRAIVVVLLFVLGIFLTLAAFGAAGIAGSDAYRLFAYLLGVGYFLLPILFFVLAGTALKEEATGFTPLKIGASLLFIFAGLGFIDIVAGKGGLVGEGVRRCVCEERFAGGAGPGEGRGQACLSQLYGLHLHEL